MVIRLGRNGRFLACSMYPEHKESRPLPGDELPPQEGSGEVCPKCGEGTLVGKTGRFGPFLGCSRYPECDYIKKEGPPPPDPLPFEVICPKNKDGLLVPRRAGGPVTSSGGAPSTPSATTRPTTSRSAACTTRTTGRWRARARRRSASCAGRRATRPRTTSPRRALYRRAADPDALARPARGGGRAGAGRAGGRPRGGARGGARGSRRRGRPTRTGRGGVSAVAGEPATHPTLERFLRSLAARDASPHTIRAYRPPWARTSAGSASAASIGDALRGPTCAPTSPTWEARPPDRPWPSGSPRSGPSIAGRRARARRG